tara:strand:- start:3254 stop:3412 length:159 start_codon:yes stop_codon:yes gene_type:complete
MASDDNKDLFLEQRYQDYLEEGFSKEKAGELAWDDYWNENWEVPNLKEEDDG